MPHAPAAASGSAGSPTTEAETSRRLRRVVGASLVGTTVEWYDFFIYASAAGLVFGSQFFPSLDGTAALLASFATLGVSFVARPIGGVLAGHLGDRVGRKAVLVATLLLMGVSTVGVGLLPSYATIGVAAPILLVVLRLLQGLSAGGEWGGAALMSVEHAPPGRRGFYGSLPQLGVPLGLLLANLVFFTVSATTTPGSVPGLGLADPVPAVDRADRGRIVRPRQRCGEPGVRRAAPPAQPALGTHGRAAPHQPARARRRDRPVRRQQHGRVHPDRLHHLLRHAHAGPRRARRC